MQIIDLLQWECPIDKETSLTCRKSGNLDMCPPIYFTGHYCYLSTSVSVIRFPWSLVDGLISCSNIGFDTLSSSCGHKVKFHIKHSGCIIKLVSGTTCRCGWEQCISLEQKLHKATLSPSFWFHFTNRLDFCG